MRRTKCGPVSPIPDRPQPARPGEHEEAGPARRASRQAAAITTTLGDVGGFRTAQSLHDELRRRGQAVGLATVYRQLRRMADDGAVDVVTGPEGEAAYRLCGPATTATPHAHHHHLVCRRCGYTVEVEGPEVEAWAERVAADAGFANVNHTVEIFGDCCRHGRTQAV
jgi:Fur family ferric uptake transcriptional regulator